MTYYMVHSRTMASPSEVYEDEAMASAIAYGLSLQNRPHVFSVMTSGRTFTAELTVREGA